MNMSLPRVSVIIPAYNRSQLLPETLDSVLRQTIPVHEIIVVDDGSTDDTAEVMRSYAPRVTFVRQDHAGVAAAFNRGLARATGDWIAYLGSDDLWKPEKIECQLQYLQRHPDCGLVHTGYSLFGTQTGQGPDRPHFVAGDYRVEYLLFAEDWVCASSVLVRSDVPVRFHEWATASEDILYHAELLRAGVRFGYIDKALVEYRVHPGSMNFEPGGQIRGASCQMRWICETFAADLAEKKRLLATFFMKAVQAMEKEKRERRWPEYWGWRHWLASNWPPWLAQPASLRERIYPAVTYRLIDLPRRVARRLALR